MFALIAVKFVAVCVCYVTGDYHNCRSVPEDTQMSTILFVLMFGLPVSFVVLALWAMAHVSGMRNEETERLLAKLERQERNEDKDAS